MPKKSKNLKFWRNRNRKLLFIFLGACLTVFGLLWGMFWGDIFSSIMAKEMTLRPDSEVYDKWKTPPLDLSLDIYLFNWTNPEDFRNFSTKPILEQVGPYRFTEKPDKVDIQWNPENSTVTYRRKSFFYFDAEGSRGSLEDEITTLNAVALSAAAKAKQWNMVRRSMVDVGLKLYGQEMSVVKTVDEMLFTGYNDNMIDMARAMPIFGSDIDVPFDKFGWFYTRNGSADLTGVFNVFTGADDIRNIGRMHSWNYKTNTGYFADYCGMTNGSAGEFQPPNLKVDGSVSLFTPDMCRTVPLDYVEKQTIEGIEGYKYAGGPRSVDNGTLYPENLCFCGGQCVRSGVMNISACRFGSPVFMSYPHFYSGDAYYVDQVEGLKPEKDKHEFYMVLEPNTGVPLEVAARFQVNMLVDPIPGLGMFEDIPTIFFPLIWFEQKVRITPELAASLKVLPYVLLAGQVFGGVCFAVGLILLCWYPVGYLWNKNRSYELKSQHPENGKATKKAKKFPSQTNLSDSPSGVLKTPLPDDSRKAPDSSPLLAKSGSRTPKIMPKSNASP